MKLLSEKNNIFNYILKHTENSKKEKIHLLSYVMNCEGIDSNTINLLINEYILIFHNHSAEFANIINNIINNSSTLKKIADELFTYLFIYIKQFYSEFEYFKTINNPLDLKNMFIKYHGIFLNYESTFLKKRNIECIYNFELDKIFNFFSIVSDFLIRFYDYSIIEIQNQKYIVTASNKCDKLFFDYLTKGYTLYRLQKIGLISTSNSFEFFPVIPTKKLDFPINEYIEVSDNVNNKKMVKLIN